MSNDLKHKNTGVTVLKNNHYQDRKKTLLAAHKLRHKLNESSAQEEPVDFPAVYEVKNQLRELKTAVLDISKKIDSHGHE